MAWTTPRTWVAGELVTAAIGNVHWRDNLNAILSNASTLNATVVTSSLTTVATIASGIWNAGSITSSGTLTINGAGTHAFSVAAGNSIGNILTVRNSTSGTAAGSQITVGNNTASDLFYIQTQSSAYTTSGRFVADGSNIENYGAGGISISASHASGVVRIYAGGATLRVQVETDGRLTCNTGLKIAGDPGAGVGHVRFASNVIVMQGGTSGFQWKKSDDSSATLTLSDAGVVTVAGTLTVNGAGTHALSAAAGNSIGNILTIRNSTSGTAAGAQMTVGNNTASDLFYIQIQSSAYTSSGRFQADGANIECYGSGGIAITANHASGAIRYFTGGSTQVGMIDTNGWLAINTTLTPGMPLDVKATTSGGGTGIFRHTHATNPVGIQVSYEGGAPNGTGNLFVKCFDTGTTRCEIRSNGGIANFQANNVDLSDARVKNLFGELDNQRGKFRKLTFVLGAYRDSPDQTPRPMVTKQAVERVWPEDCADFEVGLGGVRVHALMIRAFRVIQELDMVIDEQGRRIAELEARAG